jgi:hypothetical protein
MYIDKSPFGPPLEEAKQGMKTPFDRLVELEVWIFDELDRCENYHPSYDRSSQAKAYRRVLDRLRPIVAEAAAVRHIFEPFLKDPESENEAHDRID